MKDGKIGQHVGMSRDQTTIVGIWCKRFCRENDRTPNNFCGLSDISSERWWCRYSRIFQEGTTSLELNSQPVLVHQLMVSENFRYCRCESCSGRKLLYVHQLDREYVKGFQ
jgi:hypothetical protein